MKKMILALSAALMLAACEKDDLSPSVAGGMQDLVVTLSLLDDGIHTRATLAEENITDLWIFDYVDGNLVQTVHKTQDDGFDAVTIPAKYGSHSLYFVASRGDSPSVTGTTVSWDRPSDTFWQKSEVIVQPGTSAVQGVQLMRVATRLRVILSDLLPDGFASFRMQPGTWYYGLDYLTGEPADSRTAERVLQVPESYIGTAGAFSVSYFSLSGADEWQTDVRLTAAKADGTEMATAVLPLVPLARNRTTSCSGALFSAERTVPVTLNEVWNEEYTMEW